MRRGVVGEDRWAHSACLLPGLQGACKAAQTVTTSLTGAATSLPAATPLPAAAALLPLLLWAAPVLSRCWSHMSCSCAWRASTKSSWALQKGLVGDGQSGR